MYPDTWIYRSFKSCNFDLWWKQNGGHGSDLRKILGFKLIIYIQTALIWKFQNAVSTATTHFDKCHYIRCLRAEFAAKHAKAPLSLTMRWWMKPDFGFCQSPDISRSHLYRGTIAWTPPTAIYQEYTVLGRLQLSNPSDLPCFMMPSVLFSNHFMCVHHLCVDTMVWLLHDVFGYGRIFSVKYFSVTYFWRTPLHSTHYKYFISISNSMDLGNATQHDRSLSTFDWIKA